MASSLIEARIKMTDYLVSHGFIRRDAVNIAVKCDEGLCSKVLTYTPSETEYIGWLHLKEPASLLSTEFIRTHAHGSDPKETYRKIIIERDTRASGEFSRDVPTESLAMA